MAEKDEDEQEESGSGESVDEEDTYGEKGYSKITLVTIILMS